MIKYVSDISGVRLVDVYKCSQNKVTGAFVRLVGTISLVKPGYPFLLLDAVVSNVNTFTFEREDIKTAVVIHLPQVDPEERKIFFGHLSEQSKEAGISYSERQLDTMPDFWGPLWLAESKGIELDMIRKLREHAWNSYKGLMERTKGETPFDYRPMQENMVFGAARREHLGFKKKGLSVPVEAQAAFFSVLFSGV